jgi:phospholipase C
MAGRVLVDIQKITSKREVRLASGSLLQSIDHFVVVMLENRSFDHMLGFLYADQGNVSTAGQPFEGLSGNERNSDGKGGQVAVFKIQPTDPHAYLMPGADPGEGYLNTNYQLFGSEQQPNPLVAATNQGFVTNFASTLAWESKQSGRVIAGTAASQVMGMFTPQTLPILSGLASGYAVCDYWFGSIPTQTIPNRAFMAMATSQGIVQDASRKVYTAPSIYNLLTQHGQTWAIYSDSGASLTRGLVSDITSAPAAHFGQFADFQKAVKQGTLPAYAFLEPSWGSSGNNQHPPYNVALGEQFLHDVYYTLFGSPVWGSTLLIITYDEHGGCYDHVPPPENAVAPDNSVGELGFTFTRFGPRVPTVLVSPLIPAGTVFRALGPTPFDHTSILATVEKRFGLPSLTKRDAAAPDVGGVLTLQQPRRDDPLHGVAVPVSKATPVHAPGPTHLEQTVAESASLLPVSDTTDGGYHHEMPIFKSGAEAVDYARKRYQAFDEKLKVQHARP